MDLTTALGIGLPLGGSLVTLGWAGWNREKRRRFSQAKTQEQHRRQPLLEGASILWSQSDIWRRTAGKGQICIAGAGGYFSRQLPYILETFTRAHLDDYIGAILYIELDDAEEGECTRNVPSDFADRVIVAKCPNLPVGLHGCSVEEALTLRHLWGHDVQRATEQWLSQMQRYYLPALCLAFPSSAGHAALLYPALTAYKERYTQSPIYSTTILDSKTVVRRRFPSVRQLYHQHGLVRGTIITDNTRDHKRSDAAIALLYAAMTGATWLGDLPVQMWNGVADVFAKETGVRFATVTAWGEMVPVYHIPAWHDLPAIYHTKAAIVEEKILRGITSLLEHPELQAIPLEPAAKGATRLLYVIAPLIPEPFFRTVAERVDANLAAWRAQTDADLLINYASIGAPMSPDTQETPLFIVLLQPLADDGSAIDGLALGTHTIDPKFLPKPAYPDAFQPLLSAKE